MEKLTYLPNLRLKERLQKEIAVRKVYLVAFETAPFGKGEKERGGGERTRDRQTDLQTERQKAREQRDEIESEALSSARGSVENYKDEGSEGGSSPTG